MYFLNCGILSDVYSVAIFAVLSFVRVMFFLSCHKNNMARRRIQDYIAMKPMVSCNVEKEVVWMNPDKVSFLKQAFKDCVHCLFVEPTQAPCMLVGMVTGLTREISGEK